MKVTYRLLAIFLLIASLRSFALVEPSVDGPILTVNTVQEPHNPDTDWYRQFNPQAKYYGTVSPEIAFIRFEATPICVNQTPKVAQIVTIETSNGTWENLIDLRSELRLNCCGSMHFIVNIQAIDHQGRASQVSQQKVSAVCIPM